MIGGDFNTPVMYQDLVNSTMAPIYMPFGGITGIGLGGYNTSYLGGIQMQKQLDHDKVSLMHKKETEDKSTMKKALMALAVILGLGAIPLVRKNIKKAGGAVKYLKNKWNDIVNAFKGNKTTKQSSKQTTIKWWQKLKNKFKKSPKP